MIEHKNHEEPNIIYTDSCAECGLPVNKYNYIMLCDCCAEAKFEEEDEETNYV